MRFQLAKARLTITRVARAGLAGGHQALGFGLRPRHLARCPPSSVLTYCAISNASIQIHEPLELAL